MKLAFLTVTTALDQATIRIGSMVITNLVATMLSVPLVLVGLALGVYAGSWLLPVAATVVLVAILPNPAAAGVQFLAHGLASGDTLLGAGDGAAGLRSYGPLAAQAWLVSAAVTVAILGNLAFYATFTMPIGIVLRIVWLYVLVFWLVSHVYVYPLLFEQHRKSIWRIYRNAALMSATRPVYTVLVGVVWLVAIVITTATGFLGIFGLGLAAAIQQNATIKLLASFEADADL